MPALGSSAISARRRSHVVNPCLEPLEGRALLSQVKTSISTGREAETYAHLSALVASQRDAAQPLSSTAGLASVGRAARFYPLFRGQRRPDLHVLTARGQFFPPQGFAFTGVTVGAINTSQTSFYVFGVNRGGATAPGPFPGRPKITFDAEVVIATGSFGIEANVNILNSHGKITKSVSLPENAITFSNTHVGVFVPADLLPSTSPAGTPDPLERYSYAFWAGASPSIPKDIAGFAPESSNAPFELKTIPAS